MQDGDSALAPPPLPQEEQPSSANGPLGEVVSKGLELHQLTTDTAVPEPNNEEREQDEVCGRDGNGSVQ